MKPSRQLHIDNFFNNLHKENDIDHILKKKDSIPTRIEPKQQEPKQQEPQQEITTKQVTPLIPSEEQASILEDIDNNLNIIADCVAGSGKTTTVLFAAKRFPTKNILQITYNSQLKIEVREKVKKHAVKNLEIHTYHSLCVRYYDNAGREDAIMRKVIERHTPPKIPIPKFDIIIIDESQDMKDLFYNLVVKFIRDLKNPAAQILILGDRYQAVYKFMGADSRFLTLAHDLWEERAFENKILSTSYRLTNEIAAFVNNVMLGYPRIKTERAGTAVIYMRHNVFKVYKNIANYIVNLIRNKSAKPEDVFILAGSITGTKSPLRKLENLLVSNSIPCYYPTSDERKLDEDIIDNKVIFSTFHQAKGRERKIVIVYGFDSSYYKYYGREYDPLICPETLYVACTRAKEKLVLIEGIDEDTRPLPFLKMTHNQMMQQQYIDFVGNSLGTYPLGQLDKPDKNVVFSNIHITSPTDLVKFLKESMLPSLTTLVAELFRVEEEGTYSANIPSKVYFANGLYEEVSDINGVVIPAMYEAGQKGKSTIQKEVTDKYLIMSQSKEHMFLQDGYNTYIRKPCKTIEQFLYLGTLYISMMGELYHKMKQIQHFEWLTDEMIAQPHETLEKYLGGSIHGVDAEDGTDTVVYEDTIKTICDKYPAYGVIEIEGRMDVVTEDTIWEIKCVDTLTLEHMLQVVIYAWMWRCEYYETLGKRAVKIMNIRTGEVCVLDTESYHIDEVMALLFENKYGKVPTLTDSEFIGRCKKGFIGETAMGTEKKEAAYLFLED